ncbi:MAG: hypothetical protein QOE65_514 [Solirubrobacteraceae bacterium]|jgi:hypothetical protein|nr:hypothetical protein [Solirubrobacteraceae bacterium]
MRTTRAFIAGVGTTGSLVAAAACVFLVASAVIAFNGWPSTGFADRIDSVFVNDAPPVAWDQPGTQAVATGAGTAAGAVGATAAGPTFGAPGVVLGPNGTAVRGGPIRLPDGTIVNPGPIAAAGPGGVIGAPGSGGGNPIQIPQTGGLQRTLGDTVRQTGTGVGQTVRDTTRGVGNAVGGPAGDTVNRTGNAVGNTVDNVSNTAGSLLGGGR